MISSSATRRQYGLPAFTRSRLFLRRKDRISRILDISKTNDLINALDGDRATTYKDADLLLALQVVLLPMVLLVFKVSFS
jgi:hypothetical protein